MMLRIASTATVRLVEVISIAAVAELLFVIPALAQNAAKSPPQSRR